MNNQDILKSFITKCKNNLSENPYVVESLKHAGIMESFIFENFNIGYSDKNIYKGIGTNENLLNRLNDIGLYKNKNYTFQNHITIPVYNENKIIRNIIFLSSDTTRKINLSFLNDEGIFNSAHLKNNDSVILTSNPVHTLLLIQANYHNTTFIYGDHKKYLDFFKTHGINKCILTFDGKATFVYKLEKNNITVHRTNIDFKNKNTFSSLDKILDSSTDQNNNPATGYTKIENGFLFTFHDITYRIIGNFHEHTMSLKVNIKAVKDNDVFINSIDLYKNRERQKFIFNIMDRFGIRDHITLENDLNKIIEVIEKYKDDNKNNSDSVESFLSDSQIKEGLTLLQNPGMLEEIENDITNLGYVRERKNKILMYLVMTSRIMDDPLHSIVISRSGAGKSRLVDIIESLCPPGELKSISDLSPQALYYMQENELKNKFVVIGEKEGSRDSEYPLRELLTKKSISKAVPIKDHITGFMKTVTVKVNGPISLAETTTSSNVNPENLNRCFIISIDESEDQTKSIHSNQRQSNTIECYLAKNGLTKIVEKHHSAQTQLKNIKVFIPYAPLLTFPSGSIQTRRDNNKFLKLIKTICFLHQYQRPHKTCNLTSDESLEYIEATIEDYKTAYELLIDGILDNSMDDLSGTAKELLKIIREYIKEKSQIENIQPDKIIFTRKDIRDYSKWSFAQIRNNFKILKEHEYICLVQSKNGLAKTYKLFPDYSDSTARDLILTPEELEKKINEKNDLNTLNIHVHSGT